MRRLNVGGVLARVEENSVEVPQILTTEPCDPIIQHLGIYLQDSMLAYQEILAHPCLLLHCSQWSGWGGSLDFYQQMDG